MQRPKHMGVQFECLCKDELPDLYLCMQNAMLTASGVSMQADPGQTGGRTSSAPASDIDDATEAARPDCACCGGGDAWRCHGAAGAAAACCANAGGASSAGCARSHGCIQNEVYLSWEAYTQEALTGQKVHFP